MVSESFIREISNIAKKNVDIFVKFICDLHYRILESLRYNNMLTSQNFTYENTYLYEIKTFKK